MVVYWFATRAGRKHETGRFWCSQPGTDSEVHLAVNAVKSVAALKPQSNRLLYSNTVTGTLVSDWWTVTFGTMSFLLDFTASTLAASHI